MYIKKEFDRMYGTTWHCVVGKKWVRVCFAGGAECEADASTALAAL